MTKRNRKSAINEQEVFKPFEPMMLYDLYCFTTKFEKLYYRVSQNHPYIPTVVSRWDDILKVWVVTSYKSASHLVDCKETRNYVIKFVAKNVRFNK